MSRVCSIATRQTLVLLSCCSPCAGIALFPGTARLLGCKHYLQSYIPPLVNPGQPQEIDCHIKEVMYVGPFSNKTQVNH